ncbi:MAG: ATP-binding protein [Lachnospiraceae bacterium]|nr:ATP-binding protein [Lachnospiraceae bacterium]
MIKRDKYLGQLIEKQKNGLIKVITGLRRVGKSYLLFNIYYDYLIADNVSKDQIITLSLDDDENENYRDPKALSKYVRERITDASKTYYVLLDEIQMAISEEEAAGKTNTIEIYSVLNGLSKLRNIDLYVTGSNSRFLSKDVLTEFRGRGDEIHVYPLTFSEYMGAYDGDQFSGWSEYYTYGGLPLILSQKSDEQKAAYLRNLFLETYLVDIIERNKIRNDYELESIINILASNIGTLTNPKRIADTFASEEQNRISQNTVNSYISYLEESFLINKAFRYNVKGRKYIGTPLKYYFEDVGLRNARLNFRQQEENHIMENIVYNELRFRGFNVDVGVVEVYEKASNQSKSVKVQREVDFVANQGSRRYYVQVAFDMPDKTKEEQEKASLRGINDSFKKIIVVGNPIKLKRDEDGFTTMNIWDFLLKENSLEL